nr:Ail/Lom family outer membrane beta-barrel protein [Arsenophonus sp. ENCA]
MFLLSCLFFGAVIAKAGDQTLSFGYLNVNANGIKDSVNLMRNDVRKAGDAITNGFGVPAVVSLDSYANLGGVFMRYRYEITDDWGIISSLAYSTKDYNANAGEEKDRISTKSKVSGDYISLMIGPTYRFNEYFSIYGLIGGAYKKVSYESRSQEFKNNVLINSSKNSKSDSKTDLIYGVGMQLNFWQNATLDLDLDLGYEQSNGDWKTNAFTIGIGYKF